jgi:hypothetical protein
MSKGGQPNVEPFTPPPPQEGCNCGVCNPYIDPKYQAAYDAQQISPFIRYKSVTSSPKAFNICRPFRIRLTSFAVNTLPPTEL